MWRFFPQVGQTKAVHVVHSHAPTCTCLGCHSTLGICLRVWPCSNGIFSSSCNSSQCTQDETIPKYAKHPWTSLNLKERAQPLKKAILDSFVAYNNGSLSLMLKHTHRPFINLPVCRSLCIWNKVLLQQPNTYERPLCCNGHGKCILPSKKKIIRQLAVYLACYKYLSHN